MKKRIISIILSLVMLAGFIPVTASADGTRAEVRTYYSDFGGRLFWSFGDEKPTGSDEELFLDSEMRSFYGQTTVNILIDEEYRSHRENGVIITEPSGEVPDRTLYVFAVVGFANGERRGYNVVFDRELVAEDWSFADNVLSFRTPEDLTYLEIEVYWNRNDYDMGTFYGTDEKPVVIDVIWWGDAELAIPDGVADEDLLRRGNRIKFRVPKSVESVTFTWDDRAVIEAVTTGHIGGDDVREELTGVDSYTLTLDREVVENSYVSFFGVTFEFAWSPYAGEPELSTHYNDGAGSVFWSLGDELPTADAAHYKPAFTDSVNFAPDGEPERVNLLLDGTLSFDRGTFDETGEYEFFPTGEENVSIWVFARFPEKGGEWFAGNIVEDGKAVRDGFVFENGILSFTPETVGYVELHVYFTRAEYDYGTFGQGRENVTVVEAGFWGGSLDVRGVPEEDIFREEDRMKIIVPSATESVTFEWSEDDTVSTIRIDGAGEDGGDLFVEYPEGNSYTLALDLTWENGDPREFYYINFDFDYTGDTADTVRVFYMDESCALFWSLGDEAPTPDLDHYLWSGWDGGVNFRPNGATEKVNILVDPTRVVSVDSRTGMLVIRSNPNAENVRIFMAANYSDNNGEWFFEPIVDDGKSVNELFSYEDGILSFTPMSRREITINLYDKEDNFRFDMFRETDEKPILIEYSGADRGVYIEGVPDGDVIVCDGSAKARVPEDFEVVFRWNAENAPVSAQIEGLGEDGGWGDVDLEGLDSYTLPRGLVDQDGEPLRQHHEYFYFNDIGSEKGFVMLLAYQPEVSVFYGLDAPAEKLDDQSYFAASVRRYVKEGGEIGTVYLTLDPSRVAEFNEQSGKISFKDIPARADFSPYIFVAFVSENGEVVLEPAVEDGVAKDGYSYESGVFSFTPKSDSGVLINLFSCKSQLDFADFNCTPERPVPVEANVYGGGEITFAGVGEEDVANYSTYEKNIYRVRYGADTKEITVNWDAGRTLKAYSIDPTTGLGTELTVVKNGTLTIPLGDGAASGVLLSFVFEEKLPKPDFTDVPDDAFYAEPVAWAVANGITAGTSKTTFSPEDGCTRGQVVTFLWRAAGQPEPKSSNNPFSDVREDDYFYKAVLWAVEQGITKGTGKTTFSPEDTCTRAQIVTFLWRASGQPKPESLNNPFGDVRADDYFADAVLWAVEKKITLGTSAKTFSPEDTCTRGQIVTFLYRAK